MYSVEKWKNLGHFQFSFFGKSACENDRQFGRIGKEGGGSEDVKIHWQKRGSIAKERERIRYFPGSCTFPIKIEKEPFGIYRGN